MQLYKRLMKKVAVLYNKPDVQEYNPNDVQGCGPKEKCKGDEDGKVSVDKRPLGNFIKLKDAHDNSKNMPLMWGDPYLRHIDLL